MTAFIKPCVCIALEEGRLDLGQSEAVETYKRAEGASGDSCTFISKAQGTAARGPQIKSPKVKGAVIDLQRWYLRLSRAMRKPT